MDKIDKKLFGPLLVGDAHPTIVEHLDFDTDTDFDLGFPNVVTLGGIIDSLDILRLDV